MPSQSRFSGIAGYGAETHKAEGSHDGYSGAKVAAYQGSNYVI